MTNAGLLAVAHAHHSTLRFTLVPVFGLWQSNGLATKDSFERPLLRRSDPLAILDMVLALGEQAYYSTNRRRTVDQAANAIGGSFNDGDDEPSIDQSRHRTVIHTSTRAEQGGGAHRVTRGGNGHGVCSTTRRRRDLQGNRKACRRGGFRRIIRACCCFAARPDAQDDGYGTESIAHATSLAEYVSWAQRECWTIRHTVTLQRRDAARGQLSNENGFCCTATTLHPLRGLTASRRGCSNPG